VGGCCRQALIHILREQRRAKEIHVDGAAIDSRHDPRHVRERLDALDAPGRAPLDAIA
jgi:hypothetical protein